MSTKRVMIKIDKLSCSFDEKQILHDISLEATQHFTLLGANGSGKSTLAKAICGLVKYEGDVKIDGQNVKNLTLKERAKLLTYIPTKLELYDPYISVLEFVLLGRFVYKKSFFDYESRDKTIAKETLEILDLSHLSEHSLSSLSSGETQLVMLAQAITQQSKIIIFDEPTANLDPKNTKIIAGRIKALKEYHTVVLITHDLHLAYFINSPIAFIKKRELHYFTEGFFKEENLQELYDVRFKDMVVKYD